MDRRPLSPAARNEKKQQMERILHPRVYCPVPNCASIAVVILSAAVAALMLLQVLMLAHPALFPRPLVSNRTSVAGTTPSVAAHVDAAGAHRPQRCPTFSPSSRPVAAANTSNGNRTCEAYTLEGAFVGRPTADECTLQHAWVIQRVEVHQKEHTIAARPLSEYVESRPDYTIVMERAPAPALHLTGRLSIQLSGVPARATLASLILRLHRGSAEGPIMAVSGAENEELTGACDLVEGQLASPDSTERYTRICAPGQCSLAQAYLPKTLLDLDTGRALQLNDYYATSAGSSARTLNLQVVFVVQQQQQQLALGAEEPLLVSALVSYEASECRRAPAAPAAEDTACSVDLDCASPAVLERLETLAIPAAPLVTASLTSCTERCASASIEDRSEPWKIEPKASAPGCGNGQGMLSLSKLGVVRLNATHAVAQHAQAIDLSPCECERVPVTPDAEPVLRARPLFALVSSTGTCEDPITGRSTLGPAKGATASWSLAIPAPVDCEPSGWSEWEPASANPANCAPDSASGATCQLIAQHFADVMRPACHGGRACPALHETRAIAAYLDAEADRLSDSVCYSAATCTYGEWSAWTWLPYGRPPYRQVSTYDIYGRDRVPLKAPGTCSPRMCPRVAEYIMCASECHYSNWSMVEGTCTETGCASGEGRATFVRSLLAGPPGEWPVCSESEYRHDACWTDEMRANTEVLPMCPGLESQCNGPLTKEDACGSAFPCSDCYALPSSIPGVADFTLAPSANGSVVQVTVAASLLGNGSVRLSLEQRCPVVGARELVTVLAEAAGTPFQFDTALLCCQGTVSLVATEGSNGGGGGGGNTTMGSTTLRSCCGCSTTCTYSAWEQLVGTCVESSCLSGVGAGTMVRTPTTRNPCGEFACTDTVLHGAPCSDFLCTECYAERLSVASGNVIAVLETDEAAALAHLTVTTVQPPPGVPLLYTVTQYCPSSATAGWLAELGVNLAATGAGVPWNELAQDIALDLLCCGGTIRVHDGDATGAVLAKFTARQCCSA